MSITHEHNRPYASFNLFRARIQKFLVARILNTRADILNRTNLGMEVMHERNVHKFSWT